MQYCTYNRKVLLSNFLGCITWTSLSTFMLVSKNEIGINNIPIFETLIFIMGIVGVKLAHNNISSYKLNIFINILLETIFLIVLYITLLDNNLSMAGVAVYSIIIINGITRTMEIESARRYEDKHLKSTYSKKFLNIMRTRSRYIDLIGGTVGASIALVALTYFKVNLIDFTMVMLVLNVMQNIYDYFIWQKYLL